MSCDNSQDQIVNQVFASIFAYKDPVRKETGYLMHVQADEIRKDGEFRRNPDKAAAVKTAALKSVAKTLNQGSLKKVLTEVYSDDDEEMKSLVKELIIASITV